MSASWNLSRLAVGDPAIAADTATYRAKPDLSQNEHMEGLPLGTRGGMAIHHYFPLDGEYVIKVRLWRATADVIKGLEEQHQVEISVDGKRVKLVTIGGKDDQELSYQQLRQIGHGNRSAPDGARSGEGRAANGGGHLPDRERSAGR